MSHPVVNNPIKIEAVTDSANQNLSSGDSIFLGTVQCKATAANAVTKVITHTRFIFLLIAIFQKLDTPKQGYH